MAQRGYLGIHAEVPTAQCLRSASVVNGASRSRSRSKAKQSRAGVCPASMWLDHRYREQARSHMGLWVFPASAHDTKICGSELARDGVSTANITIN
ncbi:nucleoid-structuring protein H-NS [Pseudomonas brassicacearum]|nr:nucleoid-structuring protein H-NS [Pseudomonas brassicacearum]